MHLKVLEKEELGKAERLSRYFDSVCASLGAYKEGINDNVNDHLSLAQFNSKPSARYACRELENIFKVYITRIVV